jgi:hypothetical protein
VLTPFPRSARLVAWGTAYLQERVSLDEADEAIVGDDLRHRVVGLPGHDDPVGWTVALGILRRDGAAGMRLVLPVPGDALGLPGPAAVTEAATDAGEVAVVTGAAPLALVPTAAESPSGGVVVRWDLLPAAASIDTGGLPSVAEADRALAEQMREGIAALELLGLARGRDEVSARLAAAERDARRLSLPPTLPARAVRLVEQATRLAAVVSIAREDDGAAVTAHEALTRDAALSPLSRAARHALCAGYSAAIEPAR